MRARLLDLAQSTRPSPGPGCRPRLTPRAPKPPCRVPARRAAPPTPCPRDARPRAPSRASTPSPSSSHTRRAPIQLALHCRRRGSRSHTAQCPAPAPELHEPDPPRRARPARHVTRRPQTAGKMAALSKTRTTDVAPVSTPIDHASGPPLQLARRDQAHHAGRPHHRQLAPPRRLACRDRDQAHALHRAQPQRLLVEGAPRVHAQRCPHAPLRRARPQRQPASVPRPDPLLEARA